MPPSAWPVWCTSMINGWWEGPTPGGALLSRCSGFCKEARRVGHGRGSPGSFRGPAPHSCYMSQVSFLSLTRSLRSPAISPASHMLCFKCLILETDFPLLNSCATKKKRLICCFSFFLPLWQNTAIKVREKGLFDWQFRLQSTMGESGQLCIDTKGLRKIVTRCLRESRCLFTVSTVQRASGCSERQVIHYKGNTPTLFILTADTGCKVEHIQHCHILTWDGINGLTKISLSLDNLCEGLSGTIPSATVICLQWPWVALVV